MTKARDGPRNLGRFGVFSPPKNGSMMTSVSAALLYRQDPPSRRSTRAGGQFWDR